MKEMTTRFLPSAPRLGILYQYANQSDLLPAIWQNCINNAMSWLPSHLSSLLRPQGKVLPYKKGLDRRTAPAEMDVFLSRSMPSGLRHRVST